MAFQRQSTTQRKRESQIAQTLALRQRILKPVNTAVASKVAAVAGKPVYKAPTAIQRRSVQDMINQVAGATPDDPIRIPIEWGGVSVKPSKATQNMMIGGALLLVGGIVIYQLAKPKKVKK